MEMEMSTIKITSQNGSETLVAVVRETPKALLVKGNASEAWFPRAAIGADGLIAPWFQFTLSHSFLFHAPFTGEA
jgi:hypothetical protein